MISSLLPVFAKRRLPQVSAYYSSVPLGPHCLTGPAEQSVIMSRESKIKEMHEVLTRRHEALRRAVAGDDSLLKKFTQHSGGDVVDFACDSATSEIGSQLAEFSSRELQQVENALQKMQQGSYGKCDGCQKNIPLARLQALPYAALCISCQRAAEEAGVEPGAAVDWSQILDNDASSTDLGVNFT